MTKSVTEIFDTAPPTDSTETFDQLWAMMSGLADRVKARFELELDPSVAETAAVPETTATSENAAAE